MEILTKATFDQMKMLTTVEKWQIRNFDRKTETFFKAT